MKRSPTPPNFGLGSLTTLPSASLDGVYNYCCITPEVPAGLPPLPSLDDQDGRAVRVMFPTVILDERLLDGVLTISRWSTSGQTWDKFVASSRVPEPARGLIKAVEGSKLLWQLRCRYNPTTGEYLVTGIPEKRVRGDHQTFVVCQWRRQSQGQAPRTIAELLEMGMSRLLPKPDAPTRTKDLGPEPPQSVKVATRPEPQHERTDTTTVYLYHPPRAHRAVRIWLVGVLSGILICCIGYYNWTPYTYGAQAVGLTAEQVEACGQALSDAMNSKINPPQVAGSACQTEIDTTNAAGFPGEVKITAWNIGEMATTVGLMVWTFMIGVLGSELATVIFFAICIAIALRVAKRLR